jgi:hypothetical protein
MHELIPTQARIVLPSVIPLFHHHFHFDVQALLIELEGGLALAVEDQIRIHLHDFLFACRTIEIVFRGPGRTGYGSPSWF